MTAAFARVARAPGLVLLVVAVHFALAFLVGSTVRSAVGAGLGRYAVLAEDRLLGAFLEFSLENPAVLAGARQLLAGSALLSLALWTVLAAGVLVRLRSPASLPDVAAAAVRGLPAVLGVTFWHWIPRLVLFAVGGAIALRVMRADAWGWLGAASLVAVFGYAACALDLARCNAVLHGAPGFHPRTALGGFVQALRSPGVLLPSLLMSFGQWACTLGILAISIAGLGTAYAPWLVRGLAVLGVVFGLSRIAVAVGAGPPPWLRREPSDEERAVSRETAPADPGRTGATWRASRVS